MERRNLSYKDLSEREVSRGSIGSVPASPYSKSFLPGIKDNQRFQKSQTLERKEELGLQDKVRVLEEQLYQLRQQQEIRFARLYDDMPIRINRLLQDSQDSDQARWKETTGRTLQIQEAIRVLTESVKNALEKVQSDSVNTKVRLDQIEIKTSSTEKEIEHLTKLPSILSTNQQQSSGIITGSLQDMQEALLEERRVREQLQIDMNKQIQDLQYQMRMQEQEFLRKIQRHKEDVQELQVDQKVYVTKLEQVREEKFRGDQEHLRSIFINLQRRVDDEMHNRSNNENEYKQWIEGRLNFVQEYLRNDEQNLAEREKSLVGLMQDGISTLYEIINRSREANQVNLTKVQMLMNENIKDVTIALGQIKDNLYGKIASVEQGITEEITNRQNQSKVFQRHLTSLAEMVDGHVTKLENEQQTSENHLRQSLLALHQEQQDRDKNWKDWRDKFVAETQEAQGISAHEVKLLKKQLEKQSQQLDAKYQEIADRQNQLEGLNQQQLNSIRHELKLGDKENCSLINNEIDRVTSQLTFEMKQQEGRLEEQLQYFYTDKIKEFNEKLDESESRLRKRINTGLSTETENRKLELKNQEAILLSKLQTSEEGINAQIYNLNEKVQDNAQLAHDNYNSLLKQLQETDEDLRIWANNTIKQPLFESLNQEAQTRKQELETLNGNLNQTIKQTQENFSNSLNNLGSKVDENYQQAIKMMDELNEFIKNTEQMLRQWAEESIKNILLDQIKQEIEARQKELEELRELLRQEMQDKDDQLREVIKTTENELLEEINNSSNQLRKELKETEETVNNTIQQLEDKVDQNAKDAKEEDEKILQQLKDTDEALRNWAENDIKKMLSEYIHSEQEERIEQGMKLREDFENERDQAQVNEIVQKLIDQASKIEFEQQLNKQMNNIVQKQQDNKQEIEEKIREQAELIDTQVNRLESKIDEDIADVNNQLDEINNKQEELQKEILEKLEEEVKKLEEIIKDWTDQFKERTDLIEIDIAVEKMTTNSEIIIVKEVLQQFSDSFESLGINLDSKNTNLRSKIDKLKERINKEVQELNDLIKDLDDKILEQDERTQADLCVERLINSAETDRIQLEILNLFQKLGELSSSGNDKNSELLDKIKRIKQKLLSTMQQNIDELKDFQDEQQNELEDQAVKGVMDHILLKLLGNEEQVEVSSSNQNEIFDLLKQDEEEIEKIKERLDRIEPFVGHLNDSLSRSLKDNPPIEIIAELSNEDEEEPAVDRSSRRMSNSRRQSQPRDRSRLSPDYSDSQDLPIPD